MLWLKPDIAKLLARRDVAGLVRALRSRHCAVRQQAASALGELGDARAEGPLAAALADSALEARAAAATALGQLRAHRVVRLLAAALQDAACEVRRAAASALGQLAHADAVEALRSALEDADGEVRRAAAEALVATGGDAALWGHVWSLTAPGPSDERATQAVSAAGENALPALWAALASADGAVRAGSANALCLLPNDASVEPLSKALLDPEPQVRGKAVSALAAIADEQAVEALYRALLIGGKDVACAAVQALGDIGGAHAVACLCDALWEAPVEVQAVARTALAGSGEAPLAAAIMQVLKGGSVSAAQLDDSRVVDALCRALRRGDPSVRRTAVGALGNSSEPRARDAVVHALGDRDPQVRSAAATVLELAGVAVETAFILDRDLPESYRTNSVAFARNRDLLALANNNGQVRLWDAQQWTLLRTIEAQSYGHCRLAISGSGTMLACAGRVLQRGSADPWLDEGTGEVWLCDPATGEWEQRLTGHGQPARCVAFSDDGHWIATGSADSTAKLWQVSSIEAARESGDTVAPAPRKAGRPVSILDIEDFVFRVERYVPQVKTSFRTLGHDDGVFSMAFSPDGTVLATGSYEICLWDVHTGEQVGSLTGHTGPIWSVAFSPSGEALASADHAGVVRVWDLQAGTPRWTGTLPPPGWAVAFSPDGTIVAAGGELHAVQDGRLLQVLSDQPVTAVAFSPDGTLIALGLNPGLQIWRLEYRANTGATE